MSDANQRTKPRVALKLEIDLHTETNFYTGFAMNISAGGIFVATHVPAEVGERIPVSFLLPNNPKPIEIIGEVRWNREYNPIYPDTHPGMGLKFVDISDEEKEIINDYIRDIREPYFHPDEDE